MFFDLNLPWPTSSSFPRGPSSSKAGGGASGKKSKAKALPASPAPGDDVKHDALAALRSEEREELVQSLEMMIHMGYSVVAFNHVVHSRFDSSRHRNPFSDGPPFPEMDTRSIPKPHRNILQLSRMTLVMDDGGGGHGLVASNALALQSYDILAVRPLNESAFQTACLTLSAPKAFAIDIISLDLAASPRLPFYLKRSTVGAAIAAGVVFEVCYGPAVGAGSGDACKAEGGIGMAARRNVIAGAREIMRVTGGKGVIISSEVRRMMEFRGPFDVINMGTLFGMNQALARDAISKTCRSLVYKAETRKTYGGVLANPVVVTSTIPSAPSAEADAMADGSLSTEDGTADDGEAKKGKRGGEGGGGGVQGRQGKKRKVK